MNIQLSWEEQALQDLFAEFFLDHAPPAVTRQLEHPLGAGNADPHGFDPHLWRSLAQLDALRLTLPEEAGGLALGQSAAIILGEEMGKALYQSPYLSTVMAAELLALSGSGQINGPLLEQMGAGECIVALALRATGRENPGLLHAPGLTLHSEPSGWSITGQRCFVPFARQSDYLLVLCNDSEGPTLFFIPRDRPGIHLRRHDEIGRGEYCALTFDRTPVSSNDVLGPVGGAAHLYEQAVATARIRHAAYLVGISQSSYQTTLKYTKQRSQFGQRVASFQAISFRLAALATRLEATRLLVQHTAWLADQGADTCRQAAQALAMAGELAQDMTSETIQMHGAIGIAEEAEPQRYFRRTAVDALLWGTPSQLWEEASQRLAQEPSVSNA